MLKKTTTSVILSALLLVTFSACNDATGAKQTAKTLTTEKEKAGYAIGVQIGKQVVPTKDMIDTDTLMMGLQDALAGSDVKMTDEEMQATMQEFGKKAQEKAMAEMTKKFEANKKDGEAFLAANAKKEGVVTLPSGLQYRIVKAGTGKTPTSTDTVETNYEGRLIDGKVFDSSYQRGQSVSFPVNGVIAGWTEALQLMKEGSKWELFIPSDLAYGTKGAGQAITPNSTLIFKIELLKVK